MALSSSNDPDAGKLSPDDRKPVPMSTPNLADSAHYYPGNVEFSAPLENSVPLEAPRLTYRVLLNSSIAVPPGLQQGVQPSGELLTVDQPNNVDNPFSLDLYNSITQPEELFLQQSGVMTGADDATIIPLLEERLVVDRRKRKVGEVVVRKEIETYIIEVPVRREKLIVEQVSPEYKQLAVVDLGQVQANDINMSTNISTNASTNASTLDIPNNHLSSAISAKFTSARAAIDFLEAIAPHSNLDTTAVQINLVLANENMKAAYQKWLEQHSN